VQQGFAQIEEQLAIGGLHGLLTYFKLLTSDF
jgi:hypothetical protein